MTFRLLVIIAMGLLASEHGWAQEPVVISVNKNPSEATSDELEETEGGGFIRSWFWLMPASASTQGMGGFSGEVIPSIKTEYDLFTDRDLAFYTCGMGIGTRQLMLDFSLKFPQENGVPTSLSKMRLDIGFNRRWHFRKIRTSKFSVLQRKSAFLQYGVSFDHGVGNQNETSSEVTPMEKVQFLNGKFSVNHPLAENFLIGVEVISHVSLNKYQRTYVSGGVVLSYLFSNS